MQYETPRAHLPWTQVFEQHCPAVSAVQALPDVVQLGLSAAHAPFVHFPPQHSPSAPHLAPSEMHAAAAHCLFSQRRLQQSVAAAQATLAAPQVVKTDAQVLLFGSQTPEQQSLPPTHVSLKALQLLPASVPAPPTLLPPLLPPLIAPAAAPLPFAPTPGALSPASAALPPSPPLLPLWVAELAPFPASDPLPRPALLPIAPFPANPAAPGPLPGNELEPQATPNQVAATNTAPRLRSFGMRLCIFVCVCGEGAGIFINGQGRTRINGLDQRDRENLRRKWVRAGRFARPPAIKFRRSRH